MTPFDRFVERLCIILFAALLIAYFLFGDTDWTPVAAFFEELTDAQIAMCIPISILIFYSFVWVEKLRQIDYPKPMATKRGNVCCNSK